MSSVTQTSVSVFNVNDYLLTGTLEYPDVESVFIKEASGEVRIENNSIRNSNDLGHNPLNFDLAIHRIQAATSVIFKEIKEKTVFAENSQFINALKNLGRCLVQLVPILGNGILSVYDYVRKSCFITPAIKHNLKEIQGPVIGIAFDGKPIVIIPVPVANAAFERPADDIFGIAKKSWSTLKRKQFEQIEQNIASPNFNIPCSTLDVAHKFERVLTTPYAQSRT